MKFYRISISGWTASFRYPNLISGFQPSLEVPPLSTVLGLINAASGKYNNFDGEEIGYFFEYEMEGVDLETIYQMDSNAKTTNNNAKSNVIRRQFLYNPQLTIYTLNKKIASFFEQPIYPILLGRMNDLASIAEIKEVDLILNEKTVNISGQIVPTIPYLLPGKIQALPEYFTDTYPRKNLGTKPYSIISYKDTISTNGIKTYHDDEFKRDIFIHQIKIKNE